VAELKYAEAIREAMADELEGDDRVFLIGEEIGALGGVFTTTMGLAERFGAERVLDAPISENSFVGWAIGAAAEGLRPVVEIMFMDFVTLAMDQIVNLGAKLRYMSGGQFTIPVVIRLPSGAGTRHAAQHSQSLETWFAHTPGLVVAMPATASDAYWMLREAIRCDDPVLFVESKYLYFRQSDEVNTSVNPRPGFGGRIALQGSDLTVVTAGRMVQRVEEAARRMRESEGISCEVIDLRYLWPVDEELIGDSIARTSRLAIVHEAVEFCGWGAEIAAWAAERFMWDLDAPIVRLGARRTPVAFSQQLEDETVPTTDRIEARLMDLATQ
jgi:pyruvate/2-oxoglutarate/acetoin dehydrogenase E1 component